VVVDDFDIEGVSLAPRETDPPLVVDANTVLASAIAYEFFKSIPWRDAKVRNSARGVENCEFPVGRPLDPRRQPADNLPREYCMRPLPFERPDHVLIVTRRVSNVKRYPRSSV
jgi:hypothetical protein